MSFNEGLYNLYREVDELSLLNKLFATIISQRLNIDNYLTNTTIQKEMTLKDTLTNISYTLEEGKENVINLIKIKKGYPLFSFDDIELISLIKTHPSIEYQEVTVIKNVKGELTIILNLIKDIITKLENKNSYETISVLSNFSYNLHITMLDLNEV